MRTYVYVDGFNLYYGLGAKRNEFRWLDIRRLCELILPSSSIECVRYFTSEVELRDPDRAKVDRQRTFIRALETTGIKVYYGNFLTEKRWLKLVQEEGNARVYVTREKRSDVNLASYLLMDAWDDLYDTAAIITSDSDLITPIKIVRERFGKTVLLLNPQVGHTPIPELIDAVTQVHSIRTGPLSACLFPNELVDEEGPILRPESW